MQQGIEAIIHLYCRDRNRPTLQGDIWAAHALGIQSLIVVCGEDIVNGDHHEAKPVNDLDEIGLLNAIRSIECGTDLGGTALDGARGFVTGCAMAPWADEKALEAELHLTAKKIGAGAKLVVGHAPKEADMQKLETKKKTYLLDDDGFLLDPLQWEENFAEGMAHQLGISGRLSPSHWKILEFIRATYLKTGSCPTVYNTCRANNLHLKDLQELFPSGYQRGACKLSGVPFMAEGITSPISDTPIRTIPLDQRVYRVNVLGFLIDPNEWDCDYAAFKARELGIPAPLGEKQWQLIRHLRSEFAINSEIPTAYAACEAIGIDIDTLLELFPCGYHRGAVKIAGLCLAVKVPLDAPVRAGPIAVLA
jgi:tRNA 2-thiouridine synthesizing protein E